MEKIKVGIIGVGGISESHIAAYLKDPRAELYAFCDINEDRLKKMGEKYGITRLYNDHNEMLKLNELDAVSVCTWNNAHAECSIDALMAGKNVLCEKPMAMNAEQAQKMLDAQKASGKCLMVGFVRRYGSDCKILKDFIDAGSFGDIYYAKATYLRRNGNPGGWFSDKARSGGGPLIDLGVHVIDLTRYLMGGHTPVSVYAATFEKLGNRSNIKLSNASYRSTSAKKNDICDVEDLATALIRYDDGSVVSFEASFSLNIKADEGSIQLFGTKAGAKMDPELKIFGESNGYLTDMSLFAPTTFDFSGSFCREIAHFLDINENPATECISPASDGLMLMKILDAAYLSAKTGHEVII